MQIHFCIVAAKRYWRDLKTVDQDALGLTFIQKVDELGSI